MESKVFKLLSFIFILLQLLFVIGLAKRDIPSHVQNSSPFDFIKQLNGCHKGMKVKGVHQLKNYLKQFGYLENPNQDDDFDDALESAIKTYQQNYHINPTGQIDDATISKMTTPRCGVPDIVNGTNTMLHKNHVSVSGSGSIHTVSHYSFFSGNPKWPATKTVLTYLFLSNTSQIARDATIRAFQKWDSATRFSFAPTPFGQRPDLDIGFYGRGNHGDGFPFDGRFGVLAHAFAPTSGKFHFDADEQWVVGSVPDSIDLESIALHEIGHLLGLGHSSVETAVMFSGLAGGQVKTTLQQDDIDGIRALYA